MGFVLRNLTEEAFCCRLDMSVSVKICRRCRFSQQSTSASCHDSTKCGIIPSVYIFSLSVHFSSGLRMVSLAVEKGSLLAPSLYPAPPACLDSLYSRPIAFRVFLQFLVIFPAVGPVPRDLPLATPSPLCKKQPVIYLKSGL